MRVLHVSPRYAPRTGGVEKQVQELSERLVERGHEVTVVTGDAGGGVTGSETRNGVRVRRHRGLAPGGAFHLAPGIGPSVRRADADVVHVHNVHSLPLLFGVYGARVPVVASAYYHGGSASWVRNLFWNVYGPIARAALDRADRVTAVSEWEQSTLADDFGIDADVVPIGLERELFEAAEPHAHRRPYLLCVARLEEYKGVQHVIRALTAFDTPEYDLIVAGDGPYRDELEQLARDQGVADRVTFLGNVDHGELPAYYAGADVYLSLSAFESYGITVAEALATGTPSVVRTGSALEAWTNRRGCQGISSLSSQSVVEATLEARKRTPAVESIPEWGYVVDRYLSLYETASG